MLTLTKEQERILKHIISLHKDTQNTVSIGNQMTTYPENIDDKKLIQILTYLEQINFIKIKWIGIHRDNLNCAIDITLLPDGSNYFTNKKEKSKSNRREWVKTYIPIIISLIALIKSFESEITLILLASGEISHLESGENDQFQSDRNHHKQSNKNDQSLQFYGWVFHAFILGASMLGWHNVPTGLVPALMGGCIACSQACTAW